MKAFQRVAVWGVAAALALPSLAAAQAKGEDVFKSKCASCHGADGSGDTGVGKSMGLKSLASPAVQGASAADLTAIITNGKGKMPAYKSRLTEAQIADVVSYVKSLKK